MVAMMRRLATGLLDSGYHFRVTTSLSRTARAWWSRALIASLLFLQLATAAYACAMESMPLAAAQTAQAGDADGGAMAGMPCAQRMAGANPVALDPDDPGLCHEHCKGGSQSTEPAAALAFAAPVMVMLFVITAPAAPVGEATGWQTGRLAQGKAPPPPPHAILHCCFLI